MKILLAPLQRLGNFIEHQNETIDEIHSILSVDLKKAASESHKELKQHTVLLGEIRDLLKEQKEAQGKNNSAPKVKLPGLMSGIGAGLAIVTMAAALVAAAGIFSVMPNVNPKSLLTAIAIGATFVILSPVFVEISESLRGGGMFERVTGKIAGVDGAGINGIKDVMENVGGTGLAMISMAIAVTATSAVFMLMQQPSIAQIGTALLVGLAMIPVSFAFAKFYTAMQKRGIGLNKNGLMTIGFAATAMALSALAIVGVAYAFQLLPSALNAPDPVWVLKSGFALFVFSMPFVMVMKAIRGQSLKNIAFGALALPVLAGAIAGIAFLTSKFGNIAYENAPPVGWVLKTGLALFVFSLPFMMAMKAIKGAKLQDVVFGALALPLLAGAIFGVAWIFNYLSEVDAYNAPPVKWTLKAGLAMAVFGVPFILVATLVAKAGIGFMDLIKATLATTLIAGSILATTWIFSLLPDDYKAPSMEWALSTGIAIGIFAIPFVIVGLLAQALSPAGLLLGALGMILIAGTMWVVAWIFSTLPDLSAISKNFTDAIMYPVNSMINALKRFKDEIGIKNMLPLAGGILAIAGSWLALQAALAGSSVLGLGSSIANAAKGLVDAIGSLWGSDEAETPGSLLDKLINKADGIKKLGKALPKIGTNFTDIASNSAKVVRGLAAFEPFFNEDKVDELGDAATYTTTIATAYKKISTASKTMNVEAIKESRKMFEALTKLADSNGESTLEIFAEKLMVSVKELSETVENLKSAMGEQTSGMDVIGGLLTKAAEKIQEVAGTSTETTSEVTGDSETMFEISQILTEIEDRLNRPLRVIATD